MQPAVLIRLRPTGPWRYGPGDGGHDRLDAQYRSDRLYSALTLAMRQLGWMEEWLDATARSATPPVAFTSLFPYQGSALFVTPPATLWPPPASILTTPSPVFLSKIRWNVVRFVPASLVETILLGQAILADQWLPDPESSCLLRRDRLNAPPFRTVLRTGVGVDRLSSGSVNVHTSACVEFEPGAGLWTIARFRDEAARSDWGQRVSAAFRLLADGGFGGKRTSGWGQTEAPEIEEGTWPGLLLPKLVRALARGRGDAPSDSAEPHLHWLLSLFAPAASDQVDWTAGEYRLVVRGGYVEGASQAKKQVRMIAEGSVLSSPEDLVGAAIDVAPEAFAHPVFRSGVAVSLRLPPFVPPVAEIVETELDQILSELEVAAAQENANEPAVEQVPEAEPFPEQPATDKAASVPEEDVEAPVDPTLEEPVDLVIEELSEQSSDGPVSEPVEELPESSGNPASELIEHLPPTPQPTPPGSPEVQSEFEPHASTTPEVEPQNGDRHAESIEDPGTSGGGGPDSGI